MSEKPTAFHDLPAEEFPFLVEFYDEDGHLLHHIEVAEPGVLDVPGLAEHGPIWCQTTYPNGRRVVARPDGLVAETTKEEFSLSGYLMGRAAGRRAVIPPRDDWSAAPPGYYDDDE